MKVLVLLLLAGLLVAVGCGGESDTESAEQAGEEVAAAEEDTMDADRPARERDAADGGAASGGGDAGTTITAGDSEFGEMLFGSDDQAIYIFENDRPDETVCYGECADAWPPVFTDGEPQAASGVKDSLLGTVERRDGRLQVTYDGQPLYFYANEAPGEVRCHNVDLNGGLWWVVGPDGERRP